MEAIDSLNLQLTDLYGIDTSDGTPMWRIVWAHDQFEKRLMNVNDKGEDILTPEVREVPKYRQWVGHDKWVLEHYVVIPERNRVELADIKKGYELVYVFEDEFGKPLPPRLDFTQVVIDFIEVAKGKPFGTAKYKEDPEKQAKELDEMMDYLHGNETDVTTSLAHGEGIVVPSNYKKD